MVLAIDPGPEHSAFLQWDGRVIWEFGIHTNTELIRWLNPKAATTLVIEKIASYGMPVGAEVFETCVWTGRFMERFGAARTERIPRLEVKLHLCQSARANDANIRAALIDRFGGPDQIKKGGTLFGVSKDVWAALGLALTWWDNNATEQKRVLWASRQKQG